MTAFFSWQHAIRSSKLESTTKLVCYTIWSHMASDGTGCFPSYALIAEESGLSRRSVIEHVQKAASAGFLEIDNRQRENGSATSNLYRAVMPTGDEPAALGGERGSLGGGEPAAPPEENTLSNSTINNPYNSPTKASTRANPSRSIAVLLEDLAEIPTDLIDRAGKLGVNVLNISDEWAKFRNHHISARSKHTRVDLCWDTWCRNAAKWQARGNGASGGGAGQGGSKRYDPVAVARDRAMADLFGKRPEGHGRASAVPDTSPDPFGSGSEVFDAVCVDVGSDAETVLVTAGHADGSDTGRHE